MKFETDDIVVQKEHVDNGLFTPNPVLETKVEDKILYCRISENTWNPADVFMGVEEALENALRHPNNYTRREKLRQLNVVKVLIEDDPRSKSIMKWQRF